MDKFVIQGGQKLRGEIEVLGVKNGILPMIAGAILAAKGETIIHNVPNFMDVSTLSKILIQLGARVRYDAISRTITINCESISNLSAPYDLVKQMRASFLVIGPLLARFGQADISLPGGCAIGSRSVNMHIEALGRLGASISQEEGLIRAQANRLRGTMYHFDFPTHTGTENIMMAACLAEGSTTLVNAACEPEVAYLAQFLNKMGAQINGAGTPVIRINGVQQLNGVEIDAMPSRIETAFFMAAAAITGGDVLIRNAALSNLSIVADKMRQMGVEIEELSNQMIRVKASGRLKAVNFTTWPYPGFPTDFQPQMMALIGLSEGTGVVKETVFENRFMHVDELNRLGTNIRKYLNEAVVQGVEGLKGAPVMASDLQAGAGLILAALAAEGESTVNRVYHIDRGYEHVEIKLAKIGAVIKRVK